MVWETRSSCVGQTHGFVHLTVFLVHLFVAGAHWGLSVHHLAGHPRGSLASGSQVVGLHEITIIPGFNNPCTILMYASISELPI